MRGTSTTLGPEEKQALSLIGLELLEILLTLYPHGSRSQGAKLAR